MLRSRWNHFFFAETSPYPLAGFRILVGLYLCGYFAVLAPHVTVLFSNEGVYMPYLVPDYAPGPAIAALIFAITCALVVCFTVGYRTRLVTPLLLLAFLYHYFLQLAVKQSVFERLVVIYLVVAWLGDAGAAWALDARRSGPRAVTSWAGRLLRFQSIMLYLGAGLWKLANRNWRTGRLLHSTFASMWATELGFWIVRRDLSPSSWDAVSWSVIVGEIVLGFALCWRRTWPIGIAGAVAFHMMNVFILFIPEFLVSLTPMVFFMDPQSVRRIGEALGRRVKPRP